MDRRAGFLLLLSGLVMTGGLFFVWGRLGFHRDDVATLAAIAAVLAGFSVPGLLLVLQSQSQRHRVSTQEQLDAAVVRLAAESLSRWSDEAGVRDLNDPYPLVVRWKFAPEQVMDHAAVVSPSLNEGTRPMAESGSIDDVVSSFCSLRTPRLVIIGKPGSGKTGLLIILLLAMLKRRSTDGPVPVLLSAAAWEPLREPFSQWFAKQLLEQYPMLQPTGPFGPTAWVDLVNHGRVIPMIDELDEMGPSAIFAIQQINRMGADRPVVIASRAEEYRRVVADEDVLTAAAVLQIQPLRATDVEHFIWQRSAPGQRLRRWQSTIAHIKRHPHSSLARALSTPLMVWLLRRAYGHSASDPKYLLDKTRFPDRAAIEDHLIDSLVPSTFGRCSPEGRWLRCIAQQLRPRRPRYLPSWEPPPAPRRQWRWWELKYYGVPEFPPLSRTVRIAGYVCDVATLVTLLALALRDVLGPQIMERLQYVMVVGGIGLGLRMIRGVSELARASIYPWVPPPVEPVKLERKRLISRLSSASKTLVFTGSVHLLARQLTTNILESRSASSPISSLTQDRIAWTTYIIVGLPRAALLPLSLGVWSHWRFHGIPFSSPYSLGFVIGAWIPILIGLAYGTFAWPQFRVAHVVLALRGDLPWRLMSFLRDARLRGILRQAGPSYEFRHSRLQDRLSE